MLLKAAAVAILSIVLLPLLPSLISLSWSNSNLYKHHPGKCRQIKRTSVGSEDIQITSSGLAFISTGFSHRSCTPQYKAYAKSKGQGHLEMYDMNSSEMEARKLKIKHGKDFDPATFRPHGLSILEDKVKGEHLVYVINHTDESDDRVEKFKYLPKTKELQHVKSFFSDDFTITNDLAVFEEDKFYISNYLHFFNIGLHTLEQAYKLPLCSIVFYNGTGTTKVLPGLVSPNGVTLSKDKRLVYVSFPVLQLVRVYERRSDSQLVQIQEVPVYTSADNFHLSHDGASLLCGCHPTPRKTVQYLHNPVHKAPSQVLRLPLRADGLIVEEEITEELYDYGDLINGSTVAGVYKNKMIIGSILDSLVLCQLPPNK